MTPRRFQMNTRPATRSARPRGFSLLEALIAVVVLSTGLLALAALQSAMIRSSVDARIRSSASAAAVAVLEDLRAGGYQAIPTGANTVDVAAENYIIPDPAAAGGFTITYNSQAWFDNGGTFVTALPPGAPPPLAEFKQIDITVGWTDPYGSGQRSLVLSDLIGPLGASLTSPDLSQLGSTLNNQRPIVITQNPEGPGVIPIATGDGSETAATNPKPVIVSQGQNNTIIETRFNILNFSGAGTGDPNLVQIQKRVETSVVACRCALGAGNSLTGVFSAQFRPTYWDGSRYIPPAPTNAQPPAGPAPSGQGNNALVQSQLCTDCCRDHHDSASDIIKFDPFRAGAHQHYKLSGSTLVLAGGTDQYIEACRLIRVDGLWRVASDLNNEFFGLLKTSAVAGVPAQSPVPDPVAVTSYANFVLGALDAEFVDQMPANLATLYASNGLEDPASISITRNAGDFRWLHARGLFIDHLEQPALDAIATQRSECGSTRDCILPFVPFTTINLTELAEWSESRANVIDVLKGAGSIFGDPLDPKRGRVRALAGAGDGVIADAIANIGRSNAGLAIFVPVDPDDAAGALSDAQTFRVGTGSGPPPTSGESFNVALGNLAQIGDGSSGNDPLVASRVGTSVNDCGPVGLDTASLRDYRCATNSPLNLPASVVVSNYNGQATVTERVTCTDGNKAGDDIIDRPVCQNYRVDSVTLNGSAVNGPFPATAAVGLRAESTEVSFGSLAPEDNIVIRFALEGETRPAVLDCKVTGQGRIQSITFAACP
ncbi:MAG: prepilin-type N-terminal cleavage/methylation domain-containing protein [Xanthomonadaceae bacterium]|nr:prepilin-type N-terminal cleavage/methylation domain-containing protein [Xanthomonadaceae bacterium]